MRIVAFVPIKLTNRRLSGKNIRNLGGRPLLTWILETTVELKRQHVLDEVYLFCSDELGDVVPAEVKFLRRDKKLDEDSATGNDLCTAFAGAVEADIYCNCFATTPFLKPSTIAKCVAGIESGEYDSAITVQKHHFVWFDGRPVTYDPKRIPRTQDMLPAYSESLFYAYRKSVVEEGRRCGDRPLMVELGAIESIDIDVEEDFRVAEAIVAADLHRWTSE